MKIYCRWLGLLSAALTSAVGSPYTFRIFVQVILRAEALSKITDFLASWNLHAAY